jgi:hypothetical protein
VTRSYTPDQIAAIYGDPGDGSSLQITLFADMSWEQAAPPGTFYTDWGFYEIKGDQIFFRPDPSYSMSMGN